jgi:ABC-type lipoprotein export system ATPase subunit
VRLLLCLDSVCKSFWRGAEESPALRDVSVDVRSGDLVAVYGQRGAGKTTLLKIAAGFDAPDSGRVTFQGRDLAGMSRRALAGLHRDRIGWVERAGPHSRDLPVGDYVSLSLYGRLGPQQARRRAAVALARVGAADCADDCWADLPDAARMLVAIAQALVREPQLLIADDPTAGLGIVDRERVVGLLRQVAEDGGIAVLMAVPDMPSTLNAHQVRALHRGRLLAPARAASGGDDDNVLSFPRARRTA